MPFSSAKRNSSAPSARNSRFTTTNTALKLNMFFCASRMLRQLRFFCIMSWSRPVMAMAMNMPARNCFQKKRGWSGSAVKRTLA